ncbi:MAG: glutamate-1-semialdehyde 2,1-aminomutase [Candidatus Lambdaproteobacteria bacterium]|nr:glutamate-1-semialdehyde 2,1-aminomutase [Candidatus Lambdaproteobacteria bacterium]
MLTSQSLALFQRAQESITGGVNSPVRAFRAVGLTPLFIQRGAGSHIWDADGNEYIDYVGSWGPLILGHAHPAILAALRETMAGGTSFGAPTEREVVLAELVKEAVPSVELVRFVNSGNEATQGALRVARGFTGRAKVVKFEGCYHGSVDALLIKAGSGATTLGVPDSAGVPAAVAETTLLARFNDLGSVLELVEQHPGEIAAILIEPIPGNMGVVVPELAFLRGLREICDREAILLIFDEVMTGFRVARGGAQALFGISPDLTTFGKVIGGGLPVGAYGGRRDVMSLVAPSGPVYQAGTLSGNPLAMAAGIATLRALTEDVFAELGRNAQRLMEAWAAAAKAAGIAIQTAQFGAMMGFFFTERPIRDYADATSHNDTRRFAAFFRGMLEAGVYLAPSAFEAMFLSTAHSERDLDQTIAALGKVFATL